MKNLIILIALVLGTGAIAQSDLDIVRYGYFNEVNRVSNVKSDLTLYGFEGDTLLELVHISDMGTKKYIKEITPLLVLPEFLNAKAALVLDKLRNTRVIYSDLRDLRMRYYKLIIITHDGSTFHSDTLRI